MSYSDGKVILAGGSGYDGIYIQVSNRGANMDMSDIWLNIPDYLENGGQNPGIEDSDFWINHIFHYADGQYEELLKIKFGDCVCVCDI